MLRRAVSALARFKEFLLPVMALSLTRNRPGTFFTKKQNYHTNTIRVGWFLRVFVHHSGLSTERPPDSVAARFTRYSLY